MHILQILFDSTMCLLWIVTYTLVLIGTLKYKYLLIPPTAQAIIAPYEFAVVIKLLFRDCIGLNYFSISYICWTILEVVIIVLIIKNGYLNKRNSILYVFIIIVMFLVMSYLVVIKGYMFFFSYFNTFLGEVFWFSYVLKKDYPMKPILLAFFVTKFIADLILIPVYSGSGIYLADAMCVLLPLLDAAFIYVWLLKNKDKQEVS